MQTKAEKEENVLVRRYPRLEENTTNKARNLIFDLVDGYYRLAPDQPKYDVRIIWFCRTNENWRALLDTTLDDQMYYEISYDAKERKSHIEVYHKTEYRCVPDGEDKYNG